MLTLAFTILIVGLAVFFVLPALEILTRGEPCRKVERQRARVEQGQ